MKDIQIQIYRRIAHKQARKSLGFLRRMYFDANAIQFRLTVHVRCKQFNQLRAIDNQFDFAIEIEEIVAVNQDEGAAKLRSILQSSEEVTDGDPQERPHF
ncbi:hypothetical protein EVAR_55414_1 [Eumeta japonica]|uniref:Uncharacterized protein n=1 Tax=Eumeta variegata TaxID=151549 RepID=A0A4C1Z6V1_EUMVA|nr:hypothetical protein EVAR_55414_1 [Eumeta japonica]